RTTSCNLSLHDALPIWPNNPKPVMETIQFDHVFPLYGAIDIRNSTIERNLASTLDMEIQLHLLIEVVEELREWVRSEKLENIIRSEEHTSELQSRENVV